ncbi:MAG TPA: histidine kinase [Chthoniobacterales bacterium]|jgi:two-component sensor histidine kinase|nr:histidine kinase [Chthoniobacterales bacterium]
MNHRSTLSRPPAAYWWCQAGGWGAYLLVNVFTSQGFLSLSWRLVSGYLFMSVVGILLTHWFRAFLLRRRWLELPVGKVIPRVVAANLFLAITLVVIVTLYYCVLPPSGPNILARPRMAIVATWFVFIFNDFIILTLWSGIYFGFACFQQQRRAEIERYQAQTALAEAELRGLKNQLNPHFFFNSLNSLRGLVLEDPARAQEAITQMAAILRYHLQSGENSLVPLANEIATVEQYLALELIRFEDRLTIERAIDPAALPFLVPPLALQTLVENAIKYGVSRESGAGVVRLTVQLPDNCLEISVCNTGSLRNGPGANSTGLGLTNLRTRLRLLFAERAGLQLTEPEPGWVEARLILPATQTFERARA